jgi:MFS transporter, FHS family, L-fucose permease
MTSQVETRKGTSNATAAKYLAGAQGCFTVGRFSGTLAMKFVRARWVFLFYLASVVAFLGAATGERGNTGVAMLFITLFFESVCFPTIVALGIRGLGRHYKRGSGWIVAGVAGGACIPPLTGKVADIHNNTGVSFKLHADDRDDIANAFQIAMVVPLAFMIAAFTYAVTVNFIPYYRIPADLVGSSKIGIKDSGSSNDDLEKRARAGSDVKYDGAEALEVEQTEARRAEGRRVAPL